MDRDVCPSSSELRGTPSNRNRWKQLKTREVLITLTMIRISLHSHYYITVRFADICLPCVGSSTLRQTRGVHVLIGRTVVVIIKRSSILGHVSTSTRPSATALSGSRVSGALWILGFHFIDGVSLPTTSRWFTRGGTVVVIIVRAQQLMHGWLAVNSDTIEMLIWIFTKEHWHTRTRVEFKNELYKLHERGENVMSVLRRVHPGVQAVSVEASELGVSETSFYSIILIELVYCWRNLHGMLQLNSKEQKLP
jgi:hypothetical protein